MEAEDRRSDLATSGEVQPEVDLLQEGRLGCRLALEETRQVHRRADGATYRPEGTTVVAVAAVAPAVEDLRRA